ncbi:hypothetical protein B0H13DRAFT_2690090, partial [Mycena leptocephala]
PPPHPHQQQQRPNPRERSTDGASTASLRSGRGRGRRSRLRRLLRLRHRVRRRRATRAEAAATATLTLRIQGVVEHEHEHGTAATSAYVAASTGTLNRSLTGYYLPEHGILNGADGAFVNFLELPELLGYTRPPSASKADIARAGLKVLCRDALPAAEKGGRWRRIDGHGYTRGYLRAYPYPDPQKPYPCAGRV